MNILSITSSMYALSLSHSPTSPCWANLYLEFPLSHFLAIKKINVLSYVCRLRQYIVLAFELYKNILYTFSYIFIFNPIHSYFPFHSSNSLIFSAV